MTTSSSQHQVDQSGEAEREYIDLSEGGRGEPETIPTGDTVEADRRDASVHGHTDRPPTPDEEAAAPTKVDPAAAKAYQDALERGAHVKGEGQI